MQLARNNSEVPKLEVFLVLHQNKIQCERKIAIKMVAIIIQKLSGPHYAVVMSKYHKRILSPVCAFVVNVIL